ncbi:MAG: N-6 DNA methylase, partial [Oscillospiraceae bacterium]|nr:N-6 DNA methylase [Oscillospiraceae bacterium]
SKGLRYKKDALTSNDCEVTMKWNEVAKRVDILIAEDKYITQSDIDELIRGAKHTIEHRKIESDYDKAVVDNAKKILAEYGVDTEISETKFPLENIIEKAEAAGVPVETIAEPAEEKAVFMDVRDETFIAVQQVDEGIEYSVYAADLTIIDGGIWEMDEGMDLKSAAADLLATMEKNIVPVPDYDNFIDLADGNSDKDIPAELAKIKADVFAKINPPQKNVSESPAVNAPEKISVPDIKQPKSGVPVTYHFSPENVATGGAKSKYNANIEAIKTLQKVEAENRFATPEEQAVMAKYVGWGGIPQAFVSDKVAESISGNLGEASPSGWENEQKELLELLSPEEYKAARASTLTSFYTPPDVTDGIYQALSQFGFEGGNVLEPSMGVGNFFAKMPEDMRDNSKLYGVELDSISGRIAQQLYPNERIQVKGFEQTNFNNNSFDVVIGNIPFGDYRVSDKKYDKYNFKIHDYFAAKAVDKVKPNGVVALVTSKFTMDKLNEKARRYLAERCDLLGAVRLPAGTFKDADSVTTDILFLKKRETMTVEIPDWVHMSQTEDGIPCNKYFVDNPEMVLGKMAWDERMKGKFGDDSKVTTCYANKDIPLSEQLKNAISKIEGKIETVKEKVKDNENIKVIPADPSVRNFTHTLVDGKLYFRENEIMTEVQETGKTLDRMLGMHKIRQAAMAVIDAQAADCSDEELLKLQADLNAVYDKFKKAYGNITDVMNERCFRHDDDYNTLAALEIVDTEKKTVEKSEIFFKRTIQPELEITSVDTPQEALQVSIDRIGKVDIEYMAGLVGTSPEQLIADLGNDIFRNPAKIRDGQPYSGYEDASEYLSGNVREKLRIAKDYTKHIDSSFQRNADALEKVIPKNLEAGEISVRIGANWIDVEDYNKFLEEYAKADMVLHPVVRTRMGEYKIEGKNRDYSVAASGTYGTSRMNSYNIFENLLNQRDIVVRDRCEEDGKVWYEVNAKETQLAKEKARQMKEGFKNWIWQDIDRREKYVEKYNNLFNCIRGREYDGSYQSFPAMNPAIKLRPHQKNAILRGKLGGNTLLAHCVGAGKSFEMVATTMEKKRLGLIGKGCVVVPKHLTMQMASEWIRLYPNAKLLVAHP